MSNRPTEAGVGTKMRDLSKWILERERKGWEEMLAREARSAAAEDAAVRAYEASKGKTT